MTYSEVYPSDISDAQVAYWDTLELYAQTKLALWSDASGFWWSHDTPQDRLEAACGPFADEAERLADISDTFAGEFDDDEYPEDTRSDVELFGAGLGPVRA